MFRIHVERVLGKDIDAVFETIADHASYDRFLGVSRSLPVVQLWFDGQQFAEFARVFSIGDVRSALERPYGLLT